MIPSIGWSSFAARTVFDVNAPVRYHGDRDNLVSRVRAAWDQRQPGSGRCNLDEVVVVPLPAEAHGLFWCRWIPIERASDIRGIVTLRQPGEDPFVSLFGVGETLPVKHAKVVLYSAATLLQDGGERSTSCDWEIVAIIAGPWENAPMMPLTMARNFLRKPGGTFAPYTAQDFAESIYFWRGYVQSLT